MVLTFDAWRADGHRHQRVPTGAKLVPVVVEVPDADDRQANREADDEAAAAKSTCGCSNRGWRRLILFAVLALGVWLLLTLVPREDKKQEEATGFLFSDSVGRFRSPSLPPSCRG